METFVKKNVIKGLGKQSFLKDFSSLAKVFLPELSFVNESCFITIEA